MTTEQILLDSQAAAAAITASRLLNCGLASEQPAIFVYLLVQAVGCFVLSLFGLKSDHYFWWYLTFLTLADIAAIAVVRELFTSSVSEYRGIKTAGKISIYSVLTVSALLSVFVTWKFWQTGPDGWTHLYYVLNLHRALATSLTAVIVSLLVFLSRYPLELRRNFYVSSYFFSAVFLIDAADTLVATLSPRLFSWQADMAEILLLSVCFVVWAFLLRRVGMAPRRIVFRSVKEDELLQQLESLNQTLSRLGRR